MPEDSWFPFCCSLLVSDHFLSQGQNLCLVKALVHLAQLGIQETLLKAWVSLNVFGKEHLWMLACWVDKPPSM